jgi:hypothetical protein
MTAPSPDAELIALIDRIGRRDEAALRLLHDRTAPRLMGLAMRVVRQREWAEDVLQDRCPAARRRAALARRARPRAGIAAACVRIRCPRRAGPGRYAGSQGRRATGERSEGPVVFKGALIEKTI